MQVDVAEFWELGGLGKMTSIGGDVIFQEIDDVQPKCSLGEQMI